MKIIKRVVACVMSLVLLITMMPELKASAEEVSWPQLKTFTATQIKYKKTNDGVLTEKYVEPDKIEIVQYSELEAMGTGYYVGEIQIFVSEDYTDRAQGLAIVKTDWSAEANNGVVYNAGKQINIFANKDFTGELQLKTEASSKTYYNYKIVMKLSEGATSKTVYTLTHNIEGDGNRGNPKGFVTFKDASGNEVLGAEEGTQITAIATPNNPDYVQNPASYYEFEFVEWTDATGIQIADESKNKNEITFTMPASNVSLSAKFKNIGTTISWSSTPNGAPEVQVNDSYYTEAYPNRTNIFRTGGQAILSFRDTEWIGAGEWEFLGWTVKVNGEDRSNDSTLVSRNEGSVSAVISSIPEGNVEVIANFKRHKFASVSTTVNDNAMGTATAVVGDGTPSASAPVVYEGQVVTLIATPSERYMLDYWEVKDADGTTIIVTADEQDPNKATFTMLGTGKDITAKAYFKLDPDKASQKNELTGVTLYDPEGDTLIKAADKTGTTFTITLPEGQDITNLANFVLKFNISDYATIKVKGAEENWPVSGKGCNMTLDNPVTFVVTAENGTTQEYIVVIKQERTLSSEKEITSVKLLNGTTTIATGTLSGNVWTIDLPSDIDAALLNKIGTATDIFMQIGYTGASVKQDEGYDDANAAENMKWSSGKVMCGISPNAQANFTVTAEDGTTKDYVIKITYTASGTDTPVDPDTGDFTITVNCPTGGTITVSKNKANKNDVITVTVNPDSGYQMVAGSLKFTLGVAGGESTVITDGKFTMPSCDVTISCKWEKVQTVVNGITSFDINGVQGVVDNTTNTISVIMPYGTDVTKMIPTISGNNISSISPNSGNVLDFSKPVTFTVTLTDGTVKLYTVTIYVQSGTAADEMWDKLTDFYDQTPWWKYAEDQVSEDKYPKYW